MLNIMSLKKNKAAIDPKKSKTTAAQIRIQKDLSDLDDLPTTMSMHFPDPNNVFDFELTIKPDEGHYRPGAFKFTVNVNSNYPHEPPKVICVPKIYHPNIEPGGKVCLNILREDWKPVLNLNSVLVGLLFLFLEPNGSDPLNKDAAAVMLANPKQFEANVRNSMRGEMVDGVRYDVVV